MSWVVVVPVKGNPGAKSRLGALPERERLADAFALDTVTALLGASVVSRVFVVTADARLGARLAELGAVIVRELPQTAPSTEPKGPFAATREPDGRLNAAIRRGTDAARRDYPDANLAVFTGDLPALTALDVETTLALAAAHERSMVPDAEGTGTTTLLALAGVGVTPRFGPGSRAAHEADGHVALDLPADASIRRDVDTDRDLQAARRLGLGRHTSALLSGSPGSPRG